MPWAKNTYERAVKVYQEVLKETLLNRHQDLELTTKELLIRGEILKRDFTKRQMTILMFIITFSFNYGKEWAYIPELSDFEVAGISFKKIKHELDKLIEMNVVEWYKEDKKFRIREARFWNAPYNPSYNDQRSQELFILNLQDAGVDVIPMIQKLKEMKR